MKKKLLLLLFCCMFLLPSCRPHRENLKGYLAVNLPAPYTLPPYTSWPQGAFHRGNLLITQEEALNDFDYMWSMYFAASPLLEVIDQGQSPYTIEKIYNQIDQSRRAIKKSSTLSLMDFKGLLNQSFGALAGAGHFGVIDGGTYSFLIENLNNVLAEEEMAEDASLQRILAIITGRKTTEAYANLQKTEEVEKTQSVPAPLTVNEAIFVTREEGVPIIHIKTVTLADYRRATALLQRYVKEYGQEEHLIIDLRGNGGGNEMILQEGVLRPLLKGPVHLVQRYVCKDNPLSTYLRGVPFSAMKGAKAQPYPKPYGNGEPLTLIREEGMVAPRQPWAHKGQIWFLIDNQVGSAAESFVYKAKALNLGTFVGENTAGSGNSLQPIWFPLPNSGLLAGFEDAIGLNENGTLTDLEGISPDVYNHKGKTALETCLALINEKSE